MSTKTITGDIYESLPLDYKETVLIPDVTVEITESPLAIYKQGEAAVTRGGVLKIMPAHENASYFKPGHEYEIRTKDGNETYRFRFSRFGEAVKYYADHMIVRMA